MARITRPSRRAEFIAGHALARGLLACAAAAPPETVAIGVGDDGAPRVTAPIGWQLSLAHSGGWLAVLVAGPEVARAAIGVDLEPLPVAAMSATSPWRRRPRALAAEDVRQWVADEARFKADRVADGNASATADPTAGRDGGRHMEVGAHWLVAVPQGTLAPASPPLLIAAAKLNFPPSAFLVNLEGGSYNRTPIDLVWEQA